MLPELCRELSAAFTKVADHMRNKYLYLGGIGMGWIGGPLRLRIYALLGQASLDKASFIRSLPTGV
jgi:hypothetical protein